VLWLLGLCPSREGGVQCAAMEFEIRPITGDEFPVYVRALETAFGSEGSDEEIEAERPLFELDRSLAVFDAGRIVATAGAYSFSLTVPGPASCAAAGVTAVGVLPTHRRRGILRAMMARQLDDVYARGEALAILLASESVIYGRFGYGLSTSQLTLEIHRQYNTFARPIDTPGRLDLIGREEAIRVLPQVYDRVRPLQPGAVSRSLAWWEKHLRDIEKYRGGMSQRFYVTYRNAAGEADGYVCYRIKNDWGDGGPNCTLVIVELMTVTPEARAALWQYCLNVDLVTTVRAMNCPVDEPLRWMLADPRRLQVTRYGDWLWTRLVDIPAALAGRRYSTDGEIVFDVTDAFRPQSNARYRLVGGPEGAECRPTDRSADLALGVADLGAVYLGGASFCSLARAGRVEELTPRALRCADALFDWEPAPWCATMF